MERSIKNGDFVFWYEPILAFKAALKDGDQTDCWEKMCSELNFKKISSSVQDCRIIIFCVQIKSNLIQADLYIAWIFCTTQVFCKCFLLHVNLLQINMQMFWFPCLSKWYCHIVFQIAYLYLRSLYQDISQWVCMVWFHVSCLLVWMLCTSMLIYNWIVT